MTTMTEPTFSSTDANVDPRYYLPGFPELDELLDDRLVWGDASDLAQPSNRILRHYPGADGASFDGVVVLTFRDELVDIVAVRDEGTTNGGLTKAILPVATATLRPETVADWLRTWAAS